MITNEEYNDIKIGNIIYTINNKKDLDNAILDIEKRAYSVEKKYYKLYDEYEKNINELNILKNEPVNINLDKNKKIDN
jgi:hypothetical protein